MVYDRSSWSAHHRTFGCLAEEYQGCVSVVPSRGRSLISSCLTDPIFLSILNDVLHSIASAKVPGVYEITVKQTLPRLTASIGAAHADESWVASSALELITSVARGAPEAGLGEGFFAAIAPCVFDCLQLAEDRDVLQVRVPFPVRPPFHPTEFLLS